MEEKSANQNGEPSGEVAQGPTEAARAEQGTIILVAHNNLHLTKKAVASALAQDIPCDVIVVNNASTDGTADWLRTRDIMSYSPVHQLSLAACWNHALKLTWGVLGRKDALVINNDAEIRKDCYRLLQLWSSRTEFVTCVSVDTPERAFHPALNWSYHCRPHPDFSCFLITKKCWDTVGPFDEAYYPAYCEDSDYHVRMHRAGINAECVDLPFLHHGASTIKNSDPAEKVLIQRGADMNRLRFRAKYGCLPGTPEYSALFQ